MLPSQKLAIAAHLHVLLRRKTGRVTDTEWMAENLEYALEIVRFTRAKALEDGHPELDEWADKLELAVLAPSATRRPLAQTAAQLLKDRQPPAAAPSGFGESVFQGTDFADSVQQAEKPAKAPPANLPRYVGGIR